MTRSWIPTTATVLAMLLAGSRASAQVTPARGAAVAAGMQVSGFSVTLVLGDLQGGGVPDNLTKAAAKALADLKDFLPYKSYRLLDTGWTLGSDRATSRLQGADGKEYALDLTARQLLPNNVAVSRFQLREVGTPSGSPEPAAAVIQAEHELGVLRDRYQELRTRFLENHPDVLRLQRTVAEAERALWNARLQYEEGKGSPPAIVDTSFSMKPGETVVVGTSRLKGDKALIVLLTAVPRP